MPHSSLTIWCLTLQVRTLLGRQLVRDFPDLRRVTQVKPGCQFSFVPLIEFPTSNKVCVTRSMFTTSPSLPSASCEGAAAIVGEALPSSCGLMQHSVKSCAVGQCRSAGPGRWIWGYLHLTFCPAVPRAPF